jgi:hypothetical protein
MEARNLGVTLRVPPSTMYDRTPLTVHDSTLSLAYDYLFLIISAGVRACGDNHCPGITHCGIRSLYTGFQVYLSRPASWPPRSPWLPTCHVAERLTIAGTCVRGYELLALEIYHAQRCRLTNPFLAPYGKGQVHRLHTKSKAPTAASTTATLSPSERRTRAYTMAVYTGSRFIKLHMELRNEL